MWRGFSINELSAVSYPANSQQQAAISGREVIEVLGLANNWRRLLECKR
jgi:phage anti-repressor protein